MDSETHFLYPATLHASTKTLQISTILGSCVAVCLWDMHNRIGGMNHYMLPLWNGQGLASPKYGNIAIEKLVEKMINLGSKKIHLQAKIFGGGEVIQTEVGMFHIGERNIAIARDMLGEMKIPIVSSSVGGKLGRKIIFNTETGDVMHRFISKQNINAPQ